MINTSYGLPVVIQAVVPTGASALHRTNFLEVKFKVIATVCKNDSWSYNNFAVLRLNFLLINISVSVYPS